MLTQRMIVGAKTKPPEDCGEQEDGRFHFDQAAVYLAD